jgi:tRNA dimethylallyltransferase
LVLKSADDTTVEGAASGEFHRAGYHSDSAPDSISPADVVGQVASDYPLLAVVGPTASGKSSLAIALALRWNGEIVNCDSVQFYRGFDVGTGKVPPQERRGVPHHLLDIADPEQVFTAGDFRQEAIRVLAGIRERQRLPVIVGGTGLYLRALLLGLFAGPQRSEILRERLRSLAGRRSREFLHRMLVRLDPKAAARIHPRDTPKIIRALEVCLLARQPISALHERGREGLKGFRVLKVGLSPARASLALRINRRVEQMFAAGLLDEVRDMLSRSGADRIKPLGALGYRQAREVLAGTKTLGEAIREIQRATRRYAKRQMTWFRRESDIAWFAGFGDDPVIQQSVSTWLAKRLGERPEGLQSTDEAPPAPEVDDGDR